MQDETSSIGLPPLPPRPSAAGVWGSQGGRARGATCGCGAVHIGEVIPRVMSALRLAKFYPGPSNRSRSRDHEGSGRPATQRGSAPTNAARKRALLPASGPAVVDQRTVKAAAKRARGTAWPWPAGWQAGSGCTGRGRAVLLREAPAPRYPLTPSGVWGMGLGDVA